MLRFKGRPGGPFHHPTGALALPFPDRVSLLETRQRGAGVAVNLFF